MAGTVAGGKLAAQKNLAKDPDFYAKIGAKGGRNGRTGGFAYNPELATTAGTLGGYRSRRGHKFIRETKFYRIYTHVKSGDQVRFKRIDLQNA